MKQSFADVHILCFMYYAFTINCILNFGLKQVPLWQSKKIKRERERTIMHEKSREKLLLSTTRKKIALNTYNLFIIQHTSDCFSCKSRGRKKMYTYANEAEHNFYSMLFFFYLLYKQIQQKCNTIFLPFNFILHSVSVV